jgi:hypothetical protein
MYVWRIPTQDTCPISSGSSVITITRKLGSTCYYLKNSQSLCFLSLSISTEWTTDMLDYTERDEGCRAWMRYSNSSPSDPHLQCCYNHCHFPSCHTSHRMQFRCYIHPSIHTHTHTNSMGSVCKRTIPTKRLPLVSEVSANFLRIEGATWSVWRIPMAVFPAF